MLQRGPDCVHDHRSELDCVAERQVPEELCKFRVPRALPSATLLPADLSVCEPAALAPFRQLTLHVCYALSGNVNCAKDQIPLAESAFVRVDDGISHLRGR